MAQSGHDELGSAPSRRSVLGFGAAATAMGTSFALSSAASAEELSRVTMEDLGPGVVAWSGHASEVVGDTLYVGSRNLSPTRVAGFHVRTGTVNETYVLGNGNRVNCVVSDGNNGLYLGVTHAGDRINLYRCDLDTGEVAELANVPGLWIRHIAVAPDGMIFIVGRSADPGDPAPLYSYDPTTGAVTHLGVPAPNAFQGLAVEATETTVYCGFHSGRNRRDNGVFAVDRASGEVTRLRDGDIAQSGMKIVGNHLAVAGFDWFAVLDLADESWREFDVPTRAFTHRDGAFVLLRDPGFGLYEVDTETWTVSDVGNAYRAGQLHAHGSLVLGLLNDGRLWSVDLGSGERVNHDLLEAGAPGDAMLGMSVGTGDNLVYAGATSTYVVHDLTDGSISYDHTLTEIKDMIWVDGTMWLAEYPAGRLWAHRPHEAEPLTPVADFPPGHNRPQVVRWDDLNELVVVGVESDQRTDDPGQYYAIGTVLTAASYGVVRDDFHNVPESMPSAWMFPNPGPTKPEQYFTTRGD